MPNFNRVTNYTSRIFLRTTDHAHILRNTSTRRPSWLELLCIGMRHITIWLLLHTTSIACYESRSSRTILSARRSPCLIIRKPMLKGCGKKRLHAWLLWHCVLLLILGWGEVYWTCLSGCTGIPTEPLIVHASHGRTVVYMRIIKRHAIINVAVVGERMVQTIRASSSTRSTSRRPWPCELAYEGINCIS